jgi:predicted small secreted protein
MGQRVGARRRYPALEVPMKKLLAILALTSALAMTAACNTVRGAGQDIESAANAVDRAT